MELHYNPLIEEEFKACRGKTILKTTNYTKGKTFCSSGWQHGNRAKLTLCNYSIVKFGISLISLSGIIIFCYFEWYFLKTSSTLIFKNYCHILSQTLNFILFYFIGDLIFYFSGDLELNCYKIVL